MNELKRREGGGKEGWLSMVYLWPLRMKEQRLTDVKARGQEGHRKK